MTKQGPVTLALAAAMIMAMSVPTAFGFLSKSTGVFGSQGVRLTKQDGKILNKTLVDALDGLPNGQSAPWHNKASGTFGSVTPFRNYEHQGYKCREFILFVRPQGQDNAKQFRIPACKVPGTGWKMAF